MCESRIERGRAAAQGSSNFAQASKAMRRGLEPFKTIFKEYINEATALLGTVDVLLAWFWTFC